MVPLPGVTEDNYKILCFRLNEKDVKMVGKKKKCNTVE